jgi:hypothetical protein
MTIKNAGFLAFIGTALVSLLLIWDLISTVLNVAHGVVAAVVLFSSLVYAFGAVSIAIFFYVYSKEQR